jgi:HSP20 family protein
VTLPNGLEADKATATFENGILRLEIPKAEQVKPRQIKISAVSEGNGRRTTDDRPAELKA